VESFAFKRLLGPNVLDSLLQCGIRAIELDVQEDWVRI